MSAASCTLTCVLFIVYAPFCHRIPIPIYRFSIILFHLVGYS
nr:MAG TPA: hypothetical protein [Caudoviricetes sp.]